MQAESGRTAPPLVMMGSSPRRRLRWEGRQPRGWLRLVRCADSPSQIAPGVYTAGNQHGTALGTSAERTCKRFWRTWLLRRPRSDGDWAPRAEADLEFDSEAFPHRQLSCSGAVAEKARRVAFREARPLEGAAVAVYAAHCLRIGSMKRTSVNWGWSVSPTCLRWAGGRRGSCHARKLPSWMSSSVTKYAPTRPG